MKRCSCYFVTLVFVLLGVSACICVWVHNSAQECKTTLTTKQYRISSNLLKNIRIVHLSDLHGHVFGEDNQELVCRVIEQAPDLILMTGDMVDKRDENADVVCGLIEKLADIAPIYYCYGNHEKDWEAKNGASLVSVLETAGALVLDCTYVDITLKGQELRLGGYHGYYRQPNMFAISEEQYRQEMTFFENFEATERYKLLLCHIPTAWLDWGYIDQFPVDVVLTGHYHGGQIRLPLIGGVYAPYVGLFPEYVEGLYTGDAATCVLSAGLGSSPGIPRINNLPQIVVVDIVSQSEN